MNARNVRGLHWGSHEDAQPEAWASHENTRDQMSLIARMGAHGARMGAHGARMGAHGPRGGMYQKVGYP